MAWATLRSLSAGLFRRRHAEADMADEIAFHIDTRARDLIALDDAGVSGAVIDLMVAASYPHKFQVERRAQTGIDTFPPTIGSGFWSGDWGWGYPYGSS